jgi:lysyl-tRNA synthetase class 2
MLRNVRAFFDGQGVMEGDCPALSECASIDLYIDLMPVHVADNRVRYLHSSAEYGMKRLLAEGSGDIFQMSHVFRRGERSRRHTPEFTLIEWYRLGFSFEQMIEDTVNLIRLFVGPVEVEQLTYREAFQRTLGIDLADTTDAQLKTALQARNIEPHDTELEGRDGLLNLLMACHVEESFRPDRITVLSHYPASQAALSRITHMDGFEVAERFECYYGGLELANGYRELADAAEQRLRFQVSNGRRAVQGKETLPVDHRFIAALESGLPDCCGVAVGFDRLLQLHLGCTSIDEVLPFTWEEA